MRKIDQKGFTGVEGLFLVVAIVAIGAAVYFAVEAKRVGSTPIATEKTVTEQPAALSKVDVQAFVKKFYDRYGKTEDQQLIDQYGTSNLKNAYAGAKFSDPIVCAQDTPASFTVSAQTVKANSASVTVVEKFSSSDITVLVNVVKEGSDLKIDSVTCPAR